VNHQRQVGINSDTQVNHQRTVGTNADRNIQNNHQRTVGTNADRNIQNNHQRTQGNNSDAQVNHQRAAPGSYTFQGDAYAYDIDGHAIQARQQRHDAIGSPFRNFSASSGYQHFDGYWVAPVNLHQGPFQNPGNGNQKGITQVYFAGSGGGGIINDTVNHQRTIQTINNDTKTSQRATQTINNDTKTSQRATQSINNDTKTSQRATQSINNDTKTPQVATPASGTLYNGYWVETQPGAQGQPGSVTGSTILLNIGQMGVLTTQGGSIQSTGPATGQYQTSSTTFLQNQVAATTTAVVQTQQGVVIWGGTPATAHN
jgi:hypothetical protein